jgi:hypothetical protein
MRRYSENPGPATVWAEEKLTLAVIFRGAERRLDVGELDLCCRVSRRGGAAVSLVPLNGTGGRATRTFGERARQHSRATLGVEPTHEFA